MRLLEPRTLGGGPDIVNPAAYHRHVMGETRNYDRVAEALAAAPSVAEADREGKQRIVVDALWEELSGKDVSWLGFYNVDPDAPEEERLVLGPCRDKPACSPIGLHGACGKSFVTGRTLIVRDVKDLGEDYIACDPRDRSEIVIPVYDPSGKPLGVLDLDSFSVGAFDPRDEAGLKEVLRVAGFRVHGTSSYEVEAEVERDG